MLKQLLLVIEKAAKMYDFFESACSFEMKEISNGSSLNSNNVFSLSKSYSLKLLVTSAIG